MSRHPQLLVKVLPGSKINSVEQSELGPPAYLPLWDGLNFGHIYLNRFHFPTELLLMNSGISGDKNYVNELKLEAFLCFIVSVNIGVESNYVQDVWKKRNRIIILS